MRRSQAFPSEFFSKDDVIDGPVIRTIADVRSEPIKSDHGEDEKPVMSFREPGTKKLILNNTNWVAIEDIYGEDSDDWRGQPVELYHEPNVWFGKDKVGGVRIRPVGNATTQSGQAESGPLLWADAVALAAKAGIDKDDLVARLKAMGADAYIASKHSQTVRNIVAFAGQNEDIPF